MKDWLVNTQGSPTFYGGDIVPVTSDDQYIAQMLYRAYMAIPHSSITGMQFKTVDETASWIKDYLYSYFIASSIIDPSRIAVEAAGTTNDATILITYTTESGYVIESNPIQFRFSVEDGMLTSLEPAEEWLCEWAGGIEYRERYCVVVTSPVAEIEVPCRPVLGSSAPLLVLGSDIDYTVTDLPISLPVNSSRSMYSIIEGLPSSASRLVVMGAILDDADGITSYIKTINGLVTAVVKFDYADESLAVPTTRNITGTARCTNAVTIGERFKLVNRYDADPVFPLRPERGTYTVELRNVLYPGTYWITYPAIKER